MFYLIDDRLDEQQALFVASLTHDLILVRSIRLPEFQDIKRKLGKADLIILHDTLRDHDVKGNPIENSSRIRDLIKDMAEDKKIPHIIFSGAVDKIADLMEKHDLIYMARKVLYDNLESFLTYYRNDKSLAYGVLIHGKPYIFKKIDAITNELMVLRNCNQSKYDNILHDLYRLTLTDCPFEAFKISLEKLSDDDFAKQLKSINKAYKQNGKNIFHRC